ncbi:hypothetical protein KY309_00975 [Candidatus Woesearchaeota archaeon]|nr:hypothetical protein [Candidatus Woesearchaeota archaeon]MBW3016166.1 hypothetical protein [Candidatus Woesearchaeota archaeon]
MKYVLLLLLLVSCVAQPYVQPGINNVSEPNQTEVVEKVMVQCWDNSTAESVDKCPKKPEPVVEVEPLEVKAPVVTAKQLLEEAQKKFTSHAYLVEDRMVMVVGNKVRHYFLKMSALDDGTPVTDVFVDTANKTAVAYCNVEREGRDILGDSFDWKRSRCKDYIDKPINVSFEKWVSKGPLEYLEEFSHLQPLLVEDSLQTISIGGNAKTVQPSLHYMLNGKRYILRIDKRYHVPLKIEREGERAIDFRDVYFDVMVLDGKPVKIDSSWVSYQPVSEYWKKYVAK